MKQLLQKYKTIVDVQNVDVHKLKWSVWNDKIAVGDDMTVLFNTLSQNAILLSLSESLRNTWDYDDSCLSTLLQGGFLVDSEKNEKEDWCASFLKAKDDMSYIDLTVVLTNDCQMRYEYCFEGAKEKKKILPSTMEDVLHFLNSQIGICKKLRVTWFGGEPLLAYMQLKEMSLALMEFCKRNDIVYMADITTNGFALNNRRCEELISVLNVKRFIITIDGPKEIHEKRRPLKSCKSSFPVIWRNIETLVRFGGMVTIRITIDKKNAANVPELLNQIANSDLKGHVRLSFCRTIDYNYTPQNVSEYIYDVDEFADVEWSLIQHAHKLGLWQYQFPHAAPLGGCLRSGDIVIGTDGEIYKCLDTLGDKRWITGQIADSNDNRGVPEWYKRWHEWTPMKSDICRNCVLMPLCNGGCPHNSLFAEKKHGTQTGCPDWKSNYKRQIISLIKEKYENKTI